VGHQRFRRHARGGRRRQRSAGAAGGATAWWSGESGRGLGIVAGLCADWGVRPFVDEQLGRGPCGVLVWGRLSR